MFFNYFGEGATTMTQVRTSRRIVFQGLGALGVAVALAGCGGGDESSGSTGSTGADGTDDAAPSTSEATTPDDTDPTTADTSSPEQTEPAEPTADGLVAAADVPVGGGIVLVDDGLVVVQPTEGEFKAYSSTCTHTGTPVNQVDGTEIVCPNHGSRFSIEDGSAVQGPATAPLSEVAVALDGDQVVLA